MPFSESSYILKNIPLSFEITKSNFCGLLRNPYVLVSEQDFQFWFPVQGTKKEVNAFLTGLSVVFWPDILKAFASSIGIFLDPISK